MAVSAKGRRRLTVDGTLYLWWVAADDEFHALPGPGPSLRVARQDGELYIELHLGQAVPDRSHIFVSGTVHGASLKGRFRCPVFDMDPVTPGGARSLVDWVLAPDRSWDEVNYLGHAVR